MRISCEKILCGLIAMIGVPGNDLLCSIKLFDQHAADQHVWPGQSAEGNGQVSAPAHSLIKPISTADDDA